MQKLTTAFHKIASLKKRLRIVQGGTSAGKTYGILYYLIILASRMDYTLDISVVSESIPHLRRGALKDFIKIMNSLGIFDEERFNRSTLTYTFHSKSTIEFFSADQPDKVRGARRDILFINECNNISFETFNQLEVRTRKFVFLDYNPTGEFWVQNEIIEKDFPHDFLIVTYKDNEELSDDIIRAIEQRRGNAYWWRVYGEGLMGRLEGAIFTNWVEGEFDYSLPYGFGMDFGFFPDPTVLVRTAVDNKNKKIYAEEMFYLQKLGFQDIVDMLTLSLAKTEMIVADSAEIRVLHDLAGKGFNVYPCKKYPGCVVDRIRKLQDYQLVISPNSMNLKKELNNYIWLDKKSSTPIDAFDHAIQAITYSVDFKLLDTSLIIK